MNVWGIHMGEHVGSYPMDNGYIGIGWTELGDLSELAQSRETLKAALAREIEYEKPGAIPVHAGVLYRFVTVMAINDIVVYPSKADRMVNIGRVSGDYQHCASDAHGYPNHRAIEWLGSFTRSDFKQSALNEIGSAMTMFAIKNHRDHFLKQVDLAQASGAVADEQSDSNDDSDVESAALAAKLATEDFIIKQLHTKLTGIEFEQFIAHLLECMGYNSRVTPASGDGGVDVLAHKDELGFEPPIIKVQCKRSITNHSESDVSSLLGTLGDGEVALFVNLGSYTKATRVLERNKSKLRLIGGSELVDLILDNYSRFSPKYRALLPLKQIFVADLN